MFSRISGHLACLGAILILELRQTECVTLGQLVSLWRVTITTSKPRSDLGNIKPSWPSKPGKVVAPASLSITPDYAFSGIAYDRTESSAYPTTPRVDTEFQQWEEEEEKKYVNQILAQITSPNDTQVEYNAKRLIANLIMNVAKEENITSNTTSFQSSDYEEELLETEPVKNLPLLSERQESDNEKIVSDYFKNRPPGILNQIFPNMHKLSASLTNRNRERIRSPMVQSLIQALEPKDSSSSSSLMDLVKLIRVPSLNMSSDAGGGKRMQEQMSRLRETLNQRNISGVLDKTLQIASQPISFGSLVSTVIGLVRCNTIERLNNDANCS